MNTAVIYAEFKEDIKLAVQAAKIGTIAKNRFYDADYIFDIESPEDELYKHVVRQMEIAANKKVEDLLARLSAAYGFYAEFPQTYADYDVMIVDNNKKVYKANIKTVPTFLKAKTIKLPSKDVAFVYLLKQTQKSYNLLDKSILANPDNKAYLLADFIELVFGKEESKTFNESMQNFSQEMHDKIGYSVTKICNEENLNDLRNQLRSELLNFDYDSVRTSNSGNSDYKKYITDPIYNRIKTAFGNTYSLLLSNSEFANSFLTSEWLYRNFAASSLIDNTYIAAGYLKSIEQLLWRIIYIVGNGRPIGKVSGGSRRIVGVNEEGMDTTLGSLNFFINEASNRNLYNIAFGSDAIHVSRYLNDQLKVWTDNVRNGYFHKHNMPQSEVEEIRTQTYFLYLLILGSLALDNNAMQDLSN